jgi:hypothetical protein
LLGIASFIGLLGLEKGLLAVVFGILALRSNPLPPLTRRRAWGKVGIALGALHIVVVVMVLLLSWRILVPLLGFATDLGHAMVRGPNTVVSAPSPDGEFIAYVEDLPSFDPPNQALFVERKDQRRFMHIADLAEDVDAIEQIVWSPDSRIVVFHSRDFLTATRVTDWQTVRVYLGREWRRHQPSRHSTFTSGGRNQTVTGIEFDAPNGFSYRLKDKEQSHRVNFSASIPPS